MSKKFSEIVQSIRSYDTSIDEACWDTHKQVGMKKKGDRMVPNCVPKNEQFNSDNDKTDRESVEEDLRNWFNPSHPEGGWKRINSKGKAIGPCAREPGEAKPKCMSNAKRASLTKKERASAVKAKRKHDPNPERKGAPINVSNYGKGKLSEEKDNREYDYEGDMAMSDLRSIIHNAEAIHDLLEPQTNLPEWCQSKITLAEDYLSTVANYLRSEMNEAANPAQQAAIAIAMKKAGKTPKNEEVEQIDEKNVPTNPSLWSRAKSLARSKFDVYPSAYANGWAAKWYKSKGGGWKSVSEQFNSDVPEPGREAVSGRFTSQAAKKPHKPQPFVTSNKEDREYKLENVQKEEVITEMPGANMDTRAVHKHLKKSGWALTRTSGGHDVYTHPKSKENIAVPRHKQLKAPLVLGIMKKAKQVSEQSEEDIEKTNTPAKRSLSKNTMIVKSAATAAKEKKAAKDQFQDEPELSTQIIRNNF